jgi:hypothetical protein
MPDVMLRLPGRNLHLVRRAADCEHCGNHAAHRQVEVRSFVQAEIDRAVFGNASVLAAVRDLVAEYVPLPPANRALDAEILKHLDWLLQTERLVVIECIEVRRELPDLPRRPLVPLAARGRPVPLEDEKTWVGIELLEDTGKPVANTKYIVKGPSGTFEGTLDAKGLARITNIDPGTYDISFPDIHLREWKRA